MRYRDSIVLILIVLSLAATISLNGQTNKFDVMHPEISPEKNVLFGDDILINDQVDQNQRYLSIASAFNGWLYAIYTYNYLNTPWIAVLKSIDDGNHWSVISSGLIGLGNTYCFKTELVACGQDTTNLKLFIAFGMHNNTNNYQTIFVTRFNCRTNQPEGDILNEPSKFVWDFSLATDNLFPAYGANPNSIGILFVNSYGFIPPYTDSLIFRSSNNGGISFDNPVGVFGTHSSLQNVSLSYAFCNSYNQGRYFAAWQVKSNPSEKWGHIYTAHTEPYFNSPFTSPVQLDISPSLNNKVRNPKISCQASLSDNDLGNTTTLVVCETSGTSTNSSDILGFYNKESVTSNNYQSFLLTSGEANTESDISFNPYDMTFMLTYFDSLNQNLPYLTNNVNTFNSNSWNVVSSGYNNTSLTHAPNPKIVLNHKHQKGMNAWILERSNGNGAALFDAPFLYPVGVSNELDSLNEYFIELYPNPTHDKITLHLSKEVVTDISLSIIDSFGRTILSRTLKSNEFLNGYYQIDLSTFNNGLFLINIENNKKIYNKKLIKF